MKVKIDTKEKFHTIVPEEEVLTANMTEELQSTCMAFLEPDKKSVVLKLVNVKGMDTEVGNTIAELQQTFYDNDASFVICDVSKSIQEQWDLMEILEVMNITPTESEAWDIVQMEEIERELFNDEAN